jgi:beta-phosphoglucomutase family hydrolase
MSFELDPGVRGLIFDLDGTLADTMPSHLAAWNIACNEFGLEFSSDFLKKHTGTPARSIAKILIKEQAAENRVSLDEFLHKKSEGFKMIQHRVKAVEPVAEIAREYYGKMPMAIGTGGHHEAVERTLEIIGMRKYFDIVITAEDVTRHKPNPETFLKCAELMNIEPAHILVFEDGDLGIEAAKNAGMTSVDVRPWYKYVW